jgi:hypothetical protein
MVRGRRGKETQRGPGLTLCREATAQEMVGLHRQKVAHALRARPLRVVAVHPRHDLANSACLARRVGGGAQRVGEDDAARRPALGLHQRLHLGGVDALHFCFVKEIGGTELRSPFVFVGER